MIKDIFTMSYWTKRRKIFKIFKELENDVSEEINSVLASSKKYSQSVEASTSYFTPFYEQNDIFNSFEGQDDFENANSNDFVTANKTNDMRIMLQLWAVEHNITFAALRDLLQLLNNFDFHLPKDPRTLIASLKSCDEKIKSLAGGSYYHFGIENGLRIHLNNKIEDFSRLLQIQINIDGIPLFKSSSLQFWPILGRLMETKNKLEPFAIGVFEGTSKPKDPVLYLSAFEEEMKILKTKGFIYNDEVYNVEVINVVCDAQARFFVKQIKTCAGYSGCDKCTQSGYHNGEKMIFSEINAPLPTDAAFDKIKDEDHHRGSNPFDGLQLGMISQFPLDYTHLVCLGVMKRLIMLWVSGPKTVRIGPRVLERVSQNIKKCSFFIPREFARKQRSFVECRRWKATEFRLFFLYVGPVVLKGEIAEQVYQNFMLLSVSIRIFVDPLLCLKHCDFVESLLLAFVDHFEKFFGSSNLVYNVHALIHLVNDLKKFGSLDNFSSFPYECFLYKLKRLIRSPKHALRQLIARLQEKSATQLFTLKAPRHLVQPILKKEHTCGPVPPNYSYCRQYNMLCLKVFTITTEQPDNCFEVNEDIAFAVNILQNSSNIYVVFRKFKMIESYFSSKALHIKKVSDLDKSLDVCHIICLPHYMFATLCLPHYVCHIMVTTLYPYTTQNSFTSFK